MQHKRKGVTRRSARQLELAWLLYISEGFYANIQAFYIWHAHNLYASDGVHVRNMARQMREFNKLIRKLMREAK